MGFKKIFCATNCVATFSANTINQPSLNKNDSNMCVSVYFIWIKTMDSELGDEYRAEAEQL